VKARVKRAAAAALRVVPRPGLRMLTRLAFDRFAEGDPRRAMRDLLEIDAELEDRLNHTAIRYDRGVHAKHRLMRYHDFFVERVRAGERVLDLGCGKAELAHDLVERSGARVTGIDKNPDYLRFARRRFDHPRLELVEADFIAALPDEHYDVVVLSNVLEHLPDRSAVLRRIVQRVSPSRLLVRVPVSDREWTVPLRRELGLPHLSDPTHEVEYDLDSFRREMDDAGLEVAELRQVWGEIWAEVRPVA
jgi:SAM-dependent methyltransferase